MYYKTIFHCTFRVMLKFNKYFIIFMILMYGLVITITPVTAKNVLKEMTVLDFKVMNVSVNRGHKGFKNTIKRRVFTKLDHAHVLSKIMSKYGTTQETIPKNGEALSNFIIQKVTMDYSFAKNNSIRKWKRIKRKMRFTSKDKIIITKDTRRSNTDLTRTCGVDSYEDDLYGCEFSDENQKEQKLNLVELQRSSENQEERPKEDTTKSPKNKNTTRKQNEKPKKYLEHSNKSQEYSKERDHEPKGDNEHISNEGGEENDKADQEEQGGGKSKHSDEPTTDYIPPDIEEDLDDMKSLSKERGIPKKSSNITHITTSTPIIWVDGTTPKKQEVPSIMKICVDKARCRIPFQNN